MLTPGEPDLQIRAEQERQKFEADLEAAAAEEVQRRKQALSDTRG